jgi:single-strand DNA-binding protein
MSDVNISVISGNLTKDPVLKHTKTTNTAVCQFSVASNDKYKDKETVCYVDCQAWGKTAEFVAKYLKKGAKVIVQGKMQQQVWDDKETGKKRYRTFLLVLNVQSLQSGKQEAQPTPQTNQEPDDEYPR